MMNPFDHVKALKCTRCIHSDICMKNLGGADLDLAEADCEHFKEAVERPEKFWLVFNVPGFYDIVEYFTTFVTYSRTGLESITGTTGKQEAIVPGKELGITLFFSKEAAEVGLERIIKEQHKDDINNSRT